MKLITFKAFSGDKEISFNVENITAISPSDVEENWTLIFTK